MTKGTVGLRIEKKVPTVRGDLALGEVQNQIKRDIQNLDTLNYVYVLDSANKLKGLFSIKDLYRYPQKTKVSRTAKKAALIKVNPGTSQEKAALLALEHNLKAIPVVNRQNQFLGVLSNDSILSILYKEAREDLLHLAGIHPEHVTIDDVLKIPLAKAVEHRISWLLIGLLGGILAANIIGRFEDILSQNLVLAGFIPLIVYMSDAVGTQMEAFAIRDMAGGPINFKQYFLKQLAIVLIIALLSAIFLGLISQVLYQDSRISTVLSLALIFAVTSSVFTGLFFPYFFSRLRMDPANASGPIATIIQDLLSVVIYFAVASWLL